VALRDALDATSPSKIARALGAGALLPLRDETRFELAVLIRLAEDLERALQAREPRRWRTERALVVSNRDDVFAFVRDDGLTLRLFYNQAVLPPGKIDLGGLHYLGNRGRLRPDIVLTYERGRRRLNAVIFECKCSDDPSYLLAGYHEAALYRAGYEEHLRGAIKAVLITSTPLAAEVRDADDVVAVGWPAWPSPAVLNALIRSALADAT
jgi:hypothetical protein